MAVSAGGSNDTIQTVLSIDTQQSEKSISSLRKEIKNLKDQLVNLDKDTEEYQNTLLELGNKMHDLREINEDVARTNTDFGTTVSNLSNILQGGIAGVQGITSALSLMGVNMGDDNKLTQQLVKSMALLQATSRMDAANKSLKSMGTILKNNITAAGGLFNALKAGIKGVANSIKAFVSSNPLGLLLVAVTAVIALFNKFKSAAEEAAQKAAEAMKSKLEAELDRTRQKWEKLINLVNQHWTNIQNGSSETIAALTRNNENVENYITGLQNKLQQMMQTAARGIKNYQQIVQEELQNSAKEIYRITEQIEKEQSKQAEFRSEAEIKRLEALKQEEIAWNKVLQREAEAAGQMGKIQGYIENVQDSMKEAINGDGADENQIKIWYEQTTNWAKEMIQLLPKTAEYFKDINLDEALDDASDMIQRMNLIYTITKQVQKSFNAMAYTEYGVAEQEETRLQVAQAEQLRREARQKAQEEWRAHLERQLAAWRRTLDLAKDDAEQTMNALVFDAQQKNKNSYAIKVTLDGVEWVSHEIAEIAESLEELSAVHSAQRNRILANIAAYEEYLKQLKTIKHPTQQQKQLIEDTERAIKKEKESLRQLDEQYKTNKTDLERELEIEKRNELQHYANAKAIEKETEYMKTLLEINNKYAKTRQGGQGTSYAGSEEGANFWNDYGNAGADLNGFDKDIETLTANLEYLKEQAQGLEAQKEHLEQQYADGLISAGEYVEGMNEIENQLTENQIAQSELRQSIAQKEADKKKALLNNTLTFTRGITNAMVSVLDALADQEDISFEEQKKLKIASAVISTIQGGIDGFMSGVSSGLPAPYNLILAAATAASVVATGMLNIRKIMQTTKDNASTSGATAAAGAGKIVAAPPEIVNLNDMNTDNIDLEDQRVYVVESDITEAQRRVEVVQNNSTI